MKRTLGAILLLTLLAPPAYAQDPPDAAEAEQPEEVETTDEKQPEEVEEAPGEQPEDVDEKQPEEVEEAPGEQPEEVDTSEPTPDDTEGPPQIQTPEDAREADMFGGDEDAREADMFGGDTDDSRDDAMFGEASQDRDSQMLSGTTSNEEILAKLDERQDYLAIGGLLFLRMDYAILDKGDIEDYSLRAPNFLDIYLDARPSDRVRAFINARLSYDPAIDEGGTDRVGQPLAKQSFALDQVWLKFDIEQSVFLTVGKQRIKWGSGRFWNPTDFLNTERLNPLSVAVFDERLGVSAVKLHLPIESLGWNFYAIGTFDDANDASEVGGALRGEFVIGTSELAASTVVRKNNPYRFGLDWSGAVGPIDLKIESALINNLKTPFYRGELSTSPLSIDEFDLTGVAPEDIPAAVEAQLPGVLAARQPESYLRDDEWLPQVVVGVEYAFNYGEDDAVYLGAEYFYNHQGYDDADLYPALLAGGQFNPFYIGRHYGAVYGLLPAPGDWNDTTFVLSTLGNISDRSFVSRLDYSVTFLTYVTFNAYAQVHYGQTGEFNYSYSQDALIPQEFLDLIPDDDRESLPTELTQGISVPGPLLDVGVGLRTRF